ncbi:hypothetical protein [Allosphingosinicella deserti]|uniref:Uncharacterized protein n=1 Tax=Allosphingosinicella deserti TaxID=2116704 RepID=A0A2P7QRJ3_9SPHN|nr:hypothetical protein [Sphingomonas deserti]PSJ40593.1 hypothetical protein C7I55_09710 [Sphingomonas deserti]
MSSAELVRRALERIATCTNAKELRQLAENARTLGNDEVRKAALRKLYAVSPDAVPGTLEHDVWQSIFALEGALTEERGKTVRLARTRQKIARDGELATVSDLIMKRASDGYRMLMERGWPELTFEAVALRHPDRFEPITLGNARARLATPKA